MRIAFDLDGVLADLHAPFVRKVKELFPEIDSQAVGAADVGASPPDDEPQEERVEDVPPLPARPGQGRAGTLPPVVRDHFSSFRAMLGKPGRASAALCGTAEPFRMRR